MYLYVMCGRHRTINVRPINIPRSEGYDRLSYLPVNICICIPPHILFTWNVISEFIMEGVIIVILCTLYCNVFSPVNKTWARVASALPVCVLVLWRCGFGEWFTGRVGSYAFKAGFVILCIKAVEKCSFTSTSSCCMQVVQYIKNIQ